ncbi:MAG: hypothetical protein ACI4V5_03335, partial [Prevotella sp.]
MVFKMLKSRYHSVVNVINEERHKEDDITAVIEVCGVLVGIESQGDPNSRMFNTLPELVRIGCEIIVCACRTWGETKQLVESLRKDGYDIIWTTNPRNKNLADDLNTMWADMTVNIIEKWIKEHK